MSSSEAGGSIVVRQNPTHGGIKMDTELSFRNAERRDAPLILQFVRELADYENMLGEVVADESTL